MEIYNWHKQKPYTLAEGQAKAQTVYNNWVAKFNPDVMRPGDIIEFDYYGGHVARGRVTIPLWTGDIVDFCVSGTPYIYPSADCGTTSGGPFFGIKADIVAQCVKIGESVAEFWTFATLPQADGGVYFSLPVQVWKCPVKF